LQFVEHKNACIELPQLVLPWMLCYVMLSSGACMHSAACHYDFLFIFKGFDFVSSECVSLTSINGSCWAVNESPPVIGLLSKSPVDHRLASSFDAFIR
jgi:hypothetical protein